MMERDALIALVRRVMDFDVDSDEEYDELVERLRRFLMDPNLFAYMYGNKFLDIRTPEDVVDKALGYRPIAL